ncbi:hypothetical protein JCM3770_002823 [Rhodotorula araucariae]
MAYLGAGPTPSRTRPAWGGETATDVSGIKLEPDDEQIGGRAPNHLPAPPSAAALAGQGEAFGTWNKPRAGAANESDKDSPSSADTEMADAASVPAGRTTVLFPPGTSFRSRGAFFDACYTALFRAYGVTTHVCRDEPHMLRARCQRRKSDRCRFAIRANRVNGEWVLAGGACVWEHSHSAEGTGEESVAVRNADSESEVQWYPPSDPKGKGKGKRVHDESRSAVSTDESADSPGHGTYADAGDDAEEELLRRSASTDPIHVPGLPTPNDTFPSSKAAYQAFVRALVPVYGVSVFKTESRSTARIRCNRFASSQTASPGCAYRIDLFKDTATNRWAINAATSIFTHSHGLAIEILRNPDWRPPVHNPDARAALRLPPHTGPGAATGRMRTDKGGQTGGGSPTKQTPAASATGPSKKPRTKSPANPPQALAQAAQGRTSFPPHEPVPPSNHPGLAGAPARAPHRHPLAHRSVTPSTSSVPATTPSSAPSNPVPAFLVGLHPSLGPLAPHLVAAGFDSPSALASIALLEPTILDLTLDLIRLGAESLKARPRGASGFISVIQLKLLARLLKEMGEEARAAG